MERDDRELIPVRVLAVAFGVRLLIAMALTNAVWFSLNFGGHAEAPTSWGVLGISLCLVAAPWVRGQR